MRRGGASLSYCRNDRCPIIELHDEHEEDWAGIGRRGRQTGRKPRTKAEALAAIERQRPVVETRQTATGPVAFVACPDCEGGGCHECQESGKMSLIRWHLWRKTC